MHPAELACSNYVRVERRQVCSKGVKAGEFLQIPAFFQEGYARKAACPE
jgi:hypothetical protein